MNFLKSKAISMILILVLYTFTIYLITPEAYAEETKVCCEKTLEGSYCVYTTPAECDTSFRATNQPSSCEDTAYCQIGCCQTEEGSCLKSVSHATCINENPNNQWSADATCSYPECSKGCCVIGTECSYLTEEQCQTKQELYPNATYSFAAVSGEAECTAVCQAQDYGCCVEENNVCTYTTRNSCSSAALTNATSKVGFHLGIYCSASSLNTGDEYNCGCVPHKIKKCVDDTIYWYDSCGGREEEIEVCDFEQSKVCVQDEEDEDAYCKSVDCSSTATFEGNPDTGQARKNGESWCVYDGAVGGGADLVGSRHYRHICIDGIELSEPCRDYREEYCIQMDVEGTDRGTFREATCKANRWEDCATLCNTAKDETKASKIFEAMEEDKACCEDSEKRDCMWVDGGTTEIEEPSGDKGFLNLGLGGGGTKTTSGEVGRCVPIIAPGFAHWGGSEGEDESTGIGSSQDNGAATCSIAEGSCKVVWVKESGFDDWELVAGKECIKNSGKDFATGFNSYCRSLGDCGAHYNIIGEATYDGYTCTSDEGGCSHAGDHGDYFDIDQPDLGSFSDYENAGKGLYLGSIGKGDFPEGLQAAMQYAPEIVISAAAAIAIMSVAFEGSLMATITTTVVGILSPSTSLAGSLGAGALVGGASVSAVGSGSSIAAGATITAATETVVTSATGAVSTIPAGGSFTAGAGGATITSGSATVGAGASVAVSALAIVTFVVIVAAIAVLLFYVLGADNDEFEVELTCGPWQAPSGGSNCHLCKQEFKECSE